MALILTLGLVLILLSRDAQPRSVSLILALALFLIFLFQSKEPGSGVLLTLAIVLFFFSLPRGQTTTAPTRPVLVVTPGSPVASGTQPEAPLTSATDTPIPPPGTPSFDCQPGIQVGKTVHVVYPAVRMRLSPGYVEKDDEVDTKHYMETDDRIADKGGPQIKDGLCWWLVEHEGYQGWTADHSREGRLLLSVSP